MTNFYKNTEIYIKENFLTEAEIDYLHTCINQVLLKNKQKDLSDTSFPASFWDDKHLEITKLENFNFDFLEGIWQRAKDCYKSDYLSEEHNISFTSTNHVNVFREGVSMKVHTDTGPYAENKTIIHGFVIYLNDNYVGGEIYYPIKGIEIKPSKGSFVIHPGSSEYQHGVREVISGVRYALTMFVRES